jgi:lactose/L-arabinose transport system permease protein
MGRPKLTIGKRHGLTGWAFLSVGAGLILWMNFYPMARGLYLAMQTGVGINMRFAGLMNFERLLVDPQFSQTVFTTFLYLLVQVPIMLLFGLVLASMLNSKTLKGKGIFRTAIFLPCTVGLVAYAIIFRQMFAIDGLINNVLVGIGILETGHNWLGTAWSARLVIILGLLWRWTGFNMIFYLAGLQNIDYSIYEAARVDGASVTQVFWKITLPLLRPIILLTAIMSTNGTLQLIDESLNLTLGGPGIASRTMSHHVFHTAFIGNPNLGYASAMAFVIFVFVAILALGQMKVGDRR